MKTTYGPAVQWTADDDSKHTGVPVLVPHDERLLYITRDGLDESPSKDYGRVLIADSYTRELRFVEFGKLSPYPSEPIPNP